MLMLAKVQNFRFLDTETNSVFPVKDYKFSEKIFQTFNAIKAESKAIYGEWEKHPLAKQRKKPDVTTPSDKDSEKNESWISIVKVTVDREKGPLPQSVRFLKEAAQFVLLEELSLHLSTYFNHYEEDKYIKEYCRNDIPAFLLNNRILNLLSTPIEDRDIFIKAYPSDKNRPEGEIVSLWGSSGAVYSRFDLVLPKDTIIQQSDSGSIKIETKRLLIELEVVYNGSSAVVSNAFINNYIRKSSSNIQTLKLDFSLKAKIKPIALLTSSGWQYYKWLDSFRERLFTSFDFKTFQNINWPAIEPLLFSMRTSKQRKHKGAILPSTQDEKTAQQNAQPDSENGRGADANSQDGAAG